MDEELSESYRTLEKRLFHKGRIHSLEVKRDEELCPYIEFKLGQFTFKLTPSRLSQILKTPHALETFYTTEWSLNSFDDHPKSNYFGPKRDLVKKAITTPRTTQAQLLRDPNKLYVDDIRPNLKGWELFFKENFFCSIDKRNKVKACTAYMLYYLTIGRKFNFTWMIIYRMEEVINKHKGPMPFAMLLTRLHNHILTPQAIVSIARFTFHEHVMDPLDISKILAKKKESEFPLRRSSPLHLHHPMTMKHHLFLISMMNYPTVRI
nr:hypothetical protein [Tanacetum cinerariifolium]